MEKSQDLQSVIRMYRGLGREGKRLPGNYCKGLTVCASGCGCLCSTDCLRSVTGLPIVPSIDYWFNDRETSGRAVNENCSQTLRPELLSCYGTSWMLVMQWMSVGDVWGRNGWEDLPENREQKSGLRLMMPHISLMLHICCPTPLLSLLV